MNISLIPVPGFEKDNVDPIPTPDIVPNPIDSDGLKYNSLLSFDDCLIFELLCWIDKPESRGKTVDFLNTEIYNSFNKNNIEIPFPQRTVHLKK